MTLFTGFVVYVIVWWMILVTLLPFGKRAPDTVEPGHVGSAPERPRMWIKAAVTTVIATAVWCGIYLVMENDLISFRDGN